MITRPSSVRTFAIVRPLTQRFTKFPDCPNRAALIAPVMMPPKECM